MTRWIRGMTAAVPLLLIASAARAGDGGQVLEEGTNSEEVKLSRLACSARYCVWRSSASMGPCFSGICYDISLLVSDLEGHPIGGWGGASQATLAHFIGPAEVELADPRPFLPYGWERPPDVDPTEVATCRVKIKQVPPQVPCWPAASPPTPPREPEPPPVRPVPEPVLNSATEQCASWLADQCASFGRSDRDNCLANARGELATEFFACQGRSCLLALKGDLGNSPRFCVFEVRDGNVRRLPLEDLRSVDAVHLAQSELCWFDRSGPMGTLGEVPTCIQRSHPDRMAFRDLRGLKLQGADPYPVLKRDAPTVDASTAWHVKWGLPRWGGPGDASLHWKIAHPGEKLVVDATVDDDSVVPLGQMKAVDSDHLELMLGNIQIALLLAEGGKVQPRLWRKAAPGAKEAVAADAAFPGSGTWTRTAQGYQLHAELPLDAIYGSIGRFRSFPFSLLASDSDADKGKQKTLVGNSGRLNFWNEYPPTVAEYREFVSGAHR